jgi:hypothetical protein
MSAKEKPLLGEHWTQTGLPVLYQFYRRLEEVTRLLRQRQKAGQAPLVEHLNELAAITSNLKSLDSETSHNPESAFKALGR